MSFLCYGKYNILHTYFPLQPCWPPWSLLCPPYRRISYGNATHLNLTVVVQEEDYKAVVYVAVDRSDRSYYACDAGCLDQLVELRWVTCLVLIFLAFHFLDIGS